MVRSRMSSSLTLYGNRPMTSPYVMSVFVALHEKGLDFEFIQLDLPKGEHLTPAYQASSLSTRVPSLRHGDFVLSESSAITEYLEEVFPPPAYARLYPEDLKERARVRMVQALIRSDFMPIREERSTDTVFAGVTPKPLSAEAQAAVARLLRIASQLIPAEGRHVASAFSIADLDLSMMLQRLVANGDEVPAVLAGYARSVWERPSIRKWLALTEYAR